MVDLYKEIKMKSGIIYVNLRRVSVSVVVFGVLIMIGGGFFFLNYSNFLSALTFHELIDRDVNNMVFALKTSAIIANFLCIVFTSFSLFIFYSQTKLKKVLGTGEMTKAKLRILENLKKYSVALFTAGTILIIVLLYISFSNAKFVDSIDYQTLSEPMFNSLRNVVKYCIAMTPVLGFVISGFGTEVFGSITGLKKLSVIQ